MVLWELHVAIREHRISKLKVATALLQDQGPQCGSESEGVRVANTQAESE